MRCLVVLCAIILLAATQKGSAAEAPNPKVLAAVTDCLTKAEATAKATKDLEACIEVAAKPCFHNDETSVADNVVTQCLRDEQAAWDLLLNEAYRKLSAHLDPTQQIKLRDMQRAWIDMRTKSCNFFYDVFQGTMAYPMIANCENKETARRAIFLRLFVQDLASQK